MRLSAVWKMAMIRMSAVPEAICPAVSVKGSAIARAMLKDAPIVILDEATAYIDPENEAIVQQAVSKLVAGKTLIIIAHRLSTITDSDNIVVMQDGQIFSMGTHEELLKKSALYKEMWQAHIGAKDGEKA